MFPGFCDIFDILLSVTEINVWVTENGGNTGILQGFVADALQTVED